VYIYIYIYTAKDSDDYCQLSLNITEHLLLENYSVNSGKKETKMCVFCNNSIKLGRETLHVNRVGHEHENSQGPMSIALS